MGHSFGAILQLTVDHRMLIPHKMLTRSVLIAVVVLRLVTTATIVTRGQDSRTRRGAGGSRAMVRYLQLGQLRLNPPGIGSKCGKWVERLCDF